MKTWQVKTAHGTAELRYTAHIHPRKSGRVAGWLLIRATDRQIAEWAAGPPRWPCSTLAAWGRGGWAEFDSSGDLVDLSDAWVAADIDGAELSAWASDVMRAAGMTAHPAFRG